MQRGPTGPFVYVVKDDSTVAMRRVTLTKQDDCEAVIGSGLRSGDRVVTTGFARLTDGTQVAVSAPPPPEAVPTSSVDPPARPKGGNRNRSETQGSGERAKGRTSGGPPSGTTP